MLSDHTVEYLNELFKDDLQKEADCDESDVSLKNPSMKTLERLNELGFGSIIYAQNMHPNPLFYKYYWWVFSKYSEDEGNDFLTDKNKLCTYDAVMLVDALQKENCSFIIYNKKCPRKGNKTPFDKSKDLDWAPDYYDDTDPEWHGHK